MGAIGEDKVRMDFIRYNMHIVPAANTADL